jgi:flagellar hook-associated protein 2
MGIAITGLQSNLDTDAIISQLMSIEQAPLNRLEADRSELTSKQAAVSTISSKLLALKTAAAALTDADALTTVGVTSSDTDVLTVSNTGATGEGLYTIEVDRLAAADRWVQTAGLAALDTLVGEGRFAYTYNGETRTILTAAGTTLENLRDLINGDGGNPGVTASILEYGDTFHLMLSGKDVGGDYQLTVEADTDLVGFQPGDFQQTQDAADSRIKIDGFPPGADAWIERSSNVLTDVVPGVTVTLAGEGTATVSMTHSAASLRGKVQSWVAAYNAVYAAIDHYTGYNEQAEQAGLLQGDSTITGWLQHLRTGFMQSAVGFDASADAYTLLAQVGVEIDSEGEMSLDTETFNEAMESDADAVLALLAGGGTGSSDDARVQFTKAEAQTAGGAYEVHVEVSGGAVTVARIRGAGETAWREMTVDGNVLVGQVASDEQGLHLTVDVGAIPGTLETTVRVHEGVAETVFDYLDEALDPVGGSVEVKSDTYDAAIDRLDSRIEAMEERLLAKQQRLIDQYARLEAVLARIESMNSAFQALFQQLESIRASQR